MAEGLRYPIAEASALFGYPSSPVSSLTSPPPNGCTSSSAVTCHGSGMGHALATLVLAVVGVLASSGRKGIVTESRRGPHYGPCWTRTNDLGIKSPLLYQLS